MFHRRTKKKQIQEAPVTLDSLNGISPGRILEWLAVPLLPGSSKPMGQTRSPTLQVGILYKLSHKEVEEYWSG